MENTTMIQSVMDAIFDAIRGPNDRARAESAAGDSARVICCAGRNFFAFRHRERPQV